MLSVLFRSLSANTTTHGHPVFSALLYSFCPAAARWWIAGAVPGLPFDPLWAVVEQQSSGRTLRDVLELWGLGDLLDIARRYVSKVEAYRGQARHERVHAPEQLPTFFEEALPLNQRHRYANALERIGGWQNFLPFLRAWAFVIPDWKRHLKLHVDPEIRVSNADVAFRETQPITFPVWAFSGAGQRVVGLPVSSPGEASSFLPAFLFHFSADDNWTGSTSFYLLDPDGAALRFQTCWPAEDLVKTTLRLSDLASMGPYPPLVGLNMPMLCEKCGYVSICWQERGPKDRRMSSLALSF